MRWALDTLAFGYLLAVALMLMWTGVNRRL